MKDIAALHHLKTGDHIGDGVITHMPHVDFTGRIGKHLKDIILLFRRIHLGIEDLPLRENEPYSRFYAHGLIIAEGAKMSKSRGNVIVPDAYISKYGADTLRTYLMFLGPFDQGGDFRDTGIAGMYRFLGRVWRLVINISNDNNKPEIEPKLRKLMHLKIKEVTDDIENFRYNTAIAHIMEYVNELQNQELGIMNQEYITTLLLLLAPFAPHMTEELWQKLMNNELRIKNKEFKSIHLENWPEYDPKYLVQDEVTIIVQVNGKLRDTIRIKNQESRIKNQMEELVKRSDKVKVYLEGKKIRKTIFVPGKLINFVV